MLEDFVLRSASSKILAIDTEFMREKSYYAHLCLIQIASDTEVAVIDPFSIRKLSALGPLLENRAIVKLFHAGKQDLEILYRETGVLPKPIFDTQIAAALLGHTQQIGYAALVQAECEVRLSKIESFTDWSRRPLSESQISYAEEDVTYLPTIYEKMRAKLIEKGRLKWLDDDFDELLAQTSYEEDPYDRFKHLKRANQLSRKQLAAAREFAAWRELEAQRRDLPRKWIVADEQIIEVCKREARNTSELYMVRGLKERLDHKEAQDIIARMVAAFDSEPETWPDLDRGKKNEPNVDVEVELMSALARLRSKQYGVAFQTLVPHDELSQLARGYRKNISIIAGWRRNLVGKELLKLLNGELSLCLEKGELKVTEIPRSSEEGNH